MKFTYDTASRLTNITYHAAVTNKIDYAYDAVGNRAAQASLLANYNLPSIVSTTLYNAANHQLTFGTRQFLYDAAGNQTNMILGTITNNFAWNARGQLTNRYGNSTASYTYDGLGRRVVRTVSTTTEHYLYDGLDIILQRTSAGGAVGCRYFRGLGIDEPWQRSDVGAAATNRVYLADALGSIVALTDPAKAITTEYDYEPFGGTSTFGANNKNRFRFTGREDDTGWYYYRARYYDPATERFLSEDPIGYAGGQVNLYGYVKNNPIKYADPFGLFQYYGNWGGPNWLGGQTKAFEDLTPAERARLLPPIDSMDECFRRHDICYSAARVIVNRCKMSRRDLDWYTNICDKNLDACLRGLDEDPSKWPKPAPDPERAKWRRRGAEWYF